MATKTTNLELTKPDLDDSIEVSVFNENFDIIDAAVAEKVGKVEGMGLSQNSFTDAEKSKLSGLENYDDTEIKSDLAEVSSALNDKVDKVSGKGLSTNDFTDADKSKLDGLENYDDAEMKADVAGVSSQAAINKSTLGYQRKNLFKLQTSSEIKGGVSYTVDGEFVNAAGTTTGASTKYVFSSASDPMVFDRDVIVSYTGELSNLKAYVRRGLNSETYQYNSIPVTGLLVRAGDKVSGIYLQQNTVGTTVSASDFGVMIRYAEITDDTYEPYKPSIEERLAALEAAVMGGGVT